MTNGTKHPDDQAFLKRMIALKKVKVIIRG
jgi:hypothetical protein